MNQDLEEQKIRQLFHELRQADEHRAPSFTGVLEQAPAKTGAVKFALWRLAAVFSLLILASISAFFFLNRYAAPPGKDLAVSDEFTHKIFDYHPAVAHLGPVSTFTPKRLQKSLHRKPLRTPPSQTDVMISRWQSPTEFLLKTPGEEYLRRLPQIGDSLLEIKIDIPEETFKK